MKSKDTTAGFSLIEMVAALAIVALLVAMVPGTLRLGKRAWQTGQSSEETAAAAAVDFVTERLKGAHAIYASDDSGLPRLAFDGRAQSLSFVSEVAIGPRGGGLYKIAFGSVSAGSTQLQLTLFRPDASAPAAPDDVRDLSGGLAGVNLRYFGPADRNAAPSWQREWLRGDRLPDLIEIAPVPRTSKSLPASVVELHLAPR